MHLPQDYTKLDQQQRRMVRDEYRIRQDGKCHYCKCLLSDQPRSDVMAKKIRWSAFPPQFLKYQVHLHHSHETGLTIGAVHALCNAVLWQYHGE